MNPATPRMRFGGYPETPAPGARQPVSSPARNDRPRSSLPPAPENVTGSPLTSQPLVPVSIVDAPSQRFYACAVYIALRGWWLFDWLQMLEGNGTSTYFFCKWVVIHFTFLYTLPSLRIPWLELSPATSLAAFLVHVSADWWFMYNIPWFGHAWLLAIVQMFYDRELAISEHNVKVSSILHNSSLIMGKQIINILPEGSAHLNPKKHPYCLGPNRNTVTVPLYFNATVPIEVELLRFDLQTNAEEVVKLSRREMKEISKQAAKCAEDDNAGSYKYDVSLKKPGVYQLKKVLDEYNLEVQRTTEPTYVVPCPKAVIRKAQSVKKCLGELSDLSLNVEGTPPLKIVYSRTINGKDHSFHFQSLQPDGFSSPLLGAARSSSLISPGNEDYSWARSQKVVVALNESMTNAGEWQYAVDEVHDAFGNVVRYAQPDEQDLAPRPKHLFQNFIVRERPRATIVDCDIRNPLRVAKGKSTKLPVKIGRPGKALESVAHILTYHFSPIDTLSKTGDHGEVVEVESFTAKSVEDRPSISAPGLYTLKSVSCDSCEGEIEEPSSCLLLNPLEPKMAIQAEDIPDKCAGNAIGLRVNLDMIGTPPFRVTYSVISDDGRSRSEKVEIKGLRQQIELLPRNAGRYKYVFRKLEDAIYSTFLPSSEEFVLEQTVKPPATAYFQQGSSAISACLGQPVKLDVRFLGDGPFNLEWELVHDGKRKSEKITEITGDSFTIETAPLSSGGDYTLALKSVKDKTGCRIFLKEETRISVRRQEPRAAFGLVENKRATTVVENAPVKLPLRLSGDGPWRVSYRNLDGDSGTQIRVATSGNDFIEAINEGTYEIVDLMDSQCPGTVDPKAKTFEVRYFPRPQLSLVQTDAIQPADEDQKYTKKDICEGDVDGFEVALQGSPPYHVEYEVNYKPKTGSGSVARKEFDAALGKASIQMDTAKAGLYTYQFSALSDNLYNDKKQSRPLTLEQTVNPQPSASFLKPGQTFKLCSTEQDEGESIPIKLEGKAPFYIEVEIKHHTGNFPEVFRVPNIDANTYNLRIPRQYLKLGVQQVRIRKVRDDRGCQSKSEIGGPAVNIQLYDAPTIHPLDQRTDFCVGQRLGYTLSGTPPFEIHYDFAGKQMKAKSQTTNFRRVAESPGIFTITGVSDKASQCRAAVNISRTIHPLPSVRISRGRVSQIDIHEGSEVEIHFEFWGTPPFEFTYTRSTNAKKGQKSVILETRHDVSYEHAKSVTASLEGTYEVVSIKDKHCSHAAQNEQQPQDNQKYLTY